ncbi:MAG TPA: hypothetical protein VII35_09710, partial [Steroidobacteraceae bacterium]
MMTAIGIWVALPKHDRSSVTAASGLITKSKAHEVQNQLSSGSVKPAIVSDVWVRPTPKIAARTLRRVRFAELRRLGASEKLIDRLTDGDVLAVLTELKQLAQRGDPAAGNILAYTAHLCMFASPNVQEAQALPVQDAEWLNAAIQEKIAYNKQLLAACQQAIDQKEVMGWVTQSADQGDVASLWLLSWLGPDNPVIRQSKLLEAVAG